MFHKNYLNKLTLTLSSINTALLIAKQIVKLTNKQNWLAKTTGTNKRA